jgi:hypothetical protein
LPIVVSFVALAAGFGTARANPCRLGKEAACPVVLKMPPGATTITATGVVSGTDPDYYFRFAARAGQTITVHTEGGGLKTGPGIPVDGPNGQGLTLDEDSPATLPATGSYVIQLHANTMSDGPFGRFRLKLTIK